MDTDKQIHVAVALDQLGVRLDAQRFSADAFGYQAPLDWRRSQNAAVFALEGTGSYVTGLSRCRPGWSLRRDQHGVLPSIVSVAAD